MKRVLMVLVGLAVVAACSPPARAPEPKPPPPLKISIRPDHGWLAITGRTTVTDGTKVTLLVGRNVKFAKDDVPRSTTIAQGEATVENGAFRSRLPVDEGQLVFDANGARYGKIQAVADSVTACAQVPSATGAEPLEAIATTEFRNGLIKDLRIALGHAPVHRRQVGKPFCAIQ